MSPQNHEVECPYSLVLLPAKRQESVHLPLVHSLLPLHLTSAIPILVSVPPILLDRDCGSSFSIDVSDGMEPETVAVAVVCFLPHLGS